MRCLLAFLCLIAIAAPAHAEERFETHAWAVDETTAGLLVRDDRTPTVALYLQFPAGTWSRWAREADLPTAMEIQLYDTRGQLRRRADELAMQLSAAVGSRTSWLMARFLKQDLAEALDLVRDVLVGDDFDRAELARWRRQAKIAWKGSEKNVQFRARQLVARSLYRPGDPRLEPFLRPRRVETDRRRLREVRDIVVRLPGATVALAGDLAAVEAREIARGLLPEARERPEVDLGSALLPLLDRTERADATTQLPRLTQVYFGLGRESVSMASPHYPAFVLANHVLGGHFYSRISVALRHDRGDTYGAFARAEGGVEPGPFVIGSFTRTDNAASAEERMRETLATFCEDGISERERSEAAGHLIGRALFSRQAPSDVLLRRMRERSLGLPDGFFDELPRRAAELSLEEINAFIRAYYAPDAFVMGRVAPE